MKTAKLATMSVMIVFLSGCVNHYRITYDSEPRGAALICENINHGYTPTTIEYVLSAENEAQQQITVPLCHAKWVSGTQLTYPTTFDVKLPQKETVVLLQRPNDEGYITDAEFGLKVEQLKVQERQADATERSARAAEEKNMRLNRPMICNTVGKRTMCY